MPLVPQSTYTAWFSTTSWVYKHYAFVFSNPLWAKRVPSGASLCVYFWTAIFSLTLFRPLVYLTLGIGSLVKLLRLGKLIVWTDQFGPQCSPVVPVLPTVMLTLLVGLAGASLSALGYLLYLTWTNSVFTAAWLWVPCVVTFAVCKTYEEKHGHGADRCNVEVYNRIVLGVALVLAFTIQPVIAKWVFLHLPAVVAGAIWTAVAWCAVGLWSVAKWLLAGILAGAGHVWIGLAAFVILVIYGWLVARLGSYTLTAPDPDRMSAKERKARLSRMARTLYHQDDTLGWSETRWLRFLLTHCLDLLDQWLLGALGVESGVWETTQRVINERAAKEVEAEAARAAARAAKCKATTKALLKLVSPVVWVARQARILWSYLWQLMRAKKVGVCPYLTFTDPTPKV